MVVASAEKVNTMRALIFAVAATLTAFGSTGASAQVGGSYRATCKAVIQRGPILEATCATPSGQARRTALDVRPCGGSGVVNINGRLACSGGRAPGPRYDDRPRRVYQEDYRPRRPRYEDEYRPRRPGYGDDRPRRPRYDDRYDPRYRY
jgi:hypothetical protein